VAESEKGTTVRDNLAAFDELGFAPHTIGERGERDLATTIMAQPISLPLLISPTGAQAVHPGGGTRCRSRGCGERHGDGVEQLCQQAG
jgi:L-lactate dehydrogenase (cytochrome)/glycolate oxidase